ncbi:MAG TPA: HAMP domain-containing protein [Anaerolineae bacterium]|nr:HAMP domain-containing protein [Anaerolineae bacterium]HID83804.1 HAMP domain-containing protein [Anaerolineales bacterium]HIQ07992.1 HAMP domain-containing protein [Anaerolineaceae bacterium]
MAWWQPASWYWRWPTGGWEWGVWIVWGVGLLLGGVWWRRWRRRPWSSGYTLLAVLLLALVGLGAWWKAYPTQAALPWNPLVERRVALWLPLGSLSWGLAAGWLGVLPAMVLALLVGAARGLLWTHTAFSLWVEVTLAGAMAWAAFQPYRTRFFRVLRRPWGSALMALATYAALLLGEALVYGFSHPDTWIAPGSYGALLAFRGLELLLVGGVAWLCSSLPVCAWGRREEEATVPSPMERSLTARFAGLSFPLAVGIGLTLVVVSGVVSVQVARQMLRERLLVVTRLAATSIPSFVEAGQQHLQALAEEVEHGEASASLEEALQAAYYPQEVFFNRLLVVDAQGRIQAAYPSEQGLRLSPDEWSAVPFALSGVPMQIIPSPALGQQRAGWVSFIMPLKKQGLVLIGRADLALSPVSEPITQVLASLQDDRGLGIILDEEGRVLYPLDLAHSPVAFQPESWTGLQGQLLVVDSPAGERFWMMAQRTLGRPWWVVVLLPMTQVRQMAFRIAWPLAMVALALYGLSLLGMYSLLRVVTQSLRSLAREAQRIARGDLDHALTVEGVDEVSQLRQAFETMRRRLKERLTELAQLLEVSQRTARANRVETLVQPVLQAAQQVRPLLARVVLQPDALPAGERRSERLGYGVGTTPEVVEKIDRLVLEWTHSKTQVILRQPQGVPGWPLSRETSVGSLVALALRYEEHLFGAFYVLLPEGRTPEPHLLDYLRTLASQLSLALANVRLLLEVQLDKQRLEAILASSPDPILVTDVRGNLLLCNPAALEALGMRPDQVGLPLSEVLPVPSLAELLVAKGAQRPRVAEVALEDGRVFFASVSEVRMGARMVGRVALLRDITRYKELDALKSEFVATVSHDLRSPLTLLRGYATMLDLTANLNERQRQYLRQILQAVDSMAHLVNNLLDLGRIEAGVGLRLRQVSPEEVVRRVVAAGEPKARAKHIQLNMEVAASTPPLIEADEDLLERALGNLVDNAIKYTPAEGRVTVRVGPLEGEDGVLFAVEDTGVGIAPVDQPRLFERFFRVKRRDVQRQQGSGLGLAIVKSIVDRHHGRVWVESQLGKGSTFFIALPLRQPAGEDSAGKP